MPAVPGKHDMETNEAKLFQTASKQEQNTAHLIGFHQSDVCTAVNDTVNGSWERPS